MQCTDRKEGRSQLLRLCSSLLAPYSVDDWRAWWEDDTYSNKFVPNLNLMLVSRPTRWSLWYWYLDVYVDHLYFQIQVTAMCYLITHSLEESHGVIHVCFDKRKEKLPHKWLFPYFKRLPQKVCFFSKNCVILSTCSWFVFCFDENNIRKSIN